MLTSNNMDNSSDQFELSNYIMVPTNKSTQFDIQLVENFVLRKLPNGSMELVDKTTPEANDTAVINETTFLNPTDTVQYSLSTATNLEVNANFVADKEVGTPQMLPPVEAKKPELIYKCIKCAREFGTLVAYRKHMTWHKMTKNFNCAKCSQGFDIENNLKVHMVYVHSSFNDLCPICNTNFHRKAGLKSHILTHQVDELNTCEKCQSEFDTEDELLKHIEVHVISQAKFKNSLVCNYCKLEFKLSSEYKDHIAQHLKIKKTVLKKKCRKKRNPKQCPFMCNLCDKKFLKIAHLERHERVHSGERPYECDVCRKSFSQKITLNIHMSNHTGVKPYSCTLCPAKFNQKGNLRVHLEKTHTAQGGQQMYKCSQCACIFKRICTLNSHVTRVHVQHPPTVVEEVLKNLKMLQEARNTQESIETNQEIRSQLSTVKISEKETNGKIKRYSVKYQKIDDVRWFFCNHCTSKFKKPSDLMRHIRTKHTKEKPFKCKICSAEFSLKSLLSAHYKVHNRESIPSKSSKTSRQMRAHLKRQEMKKVPNYQCTLCNETFCTLDESREHRNMHINEISATQDIIRPYLKQPLFETIYGTLPLKPPKARIPNTGAECALNRPHVCETCNARFVKRINLIRHIQSHTGEKKYKCNICPQSFITPYRLKIHLNYHQNIRNYACKICNKRFVTCSLLKRHLMVHNTHRPYMCPYCQKKFKTLILCRTHIRNVHKLEPPENAELHVETPATEEIVPNINNVKNEGEYLVLNDAPVIESQTTNQMEYMNLTDIHLPSNVFSQNEPIFINNVGDLQDPSSIIFNIENQNMVNPNEVINNTNMSVEKQEANDVISEIINDTNWVVPWDNNVNLNIDLINESVLNELTATSEMVNNDASKDTTSLLCGNCNEFCQGLTEFEKHVCKSQQAIVEYDSINNNDVEEESVNPVTVPFPKLENPKKNAVKEEKRMFKCVLCNRRCASRQTYKRHVAAFHSNEAASTKVCKYCKKEFKKTSDLQRHLRVHTGERPFPCDICDKKFSLKSTLQGHKKTHLAVPKKIACGVCNSEFSSKSSLKTHMNIHSGHKPYKCTFCDQMFGSCVNRKKHEKNVHLKNNNKTEKKPTKPKTTPSKAAKLLETIAEEVAKNLKEENEKKKLQKDDAQENVQPSQTTENSTSKPQDDAFSQNLVNINTDPLPIDPCILITTDSGVLLSSVTLLDLDVDSRDVNKPEEQEKKEEKAPIGRKRRNNEKVKCDICLKVYSSKTVLKRHIRNVHDKKKEVDNVANSESSKIHDRKSFPCEFCGNIFTDELGLKIHFQRFHQKPNVSDETASALLNLQLDLPLEVPDGFL